jgi:hypothetical protein
MSKPMKIEMVKRMFSCEFCSNLFIEPITLPCGITICQSHLNEILQDKKCLFCQEAHGNKYQVNKSLQQMIDIQLHDIKLSPSFELCQKSIADITETMHQLDLIQADPGHFVFEYFEEIKRQVDLRKERLEENMNIYSGQIIEEINQLEAHFKAESLCQNEIFTEIEATKKLAKDLISTVDTFEINDKMFDETKQEIDILQTIVNQYLEKVKALLVGYQMFEFKSGTFTVEKVFGVFTVNVMLYFFVSFLTNKLRIIIFGFDLFINQL